MNGRMTQRRTIQVQIRRLVLDRAVLDGDPQPAHSALGAPAAQNSLIGLRSQIELCAQIEQALLPLLDAQSAALAQDASRGALRGATATGQPAWVTAIAQELALRVRSQGETS